MDEKIGLLLEELNDVTEKYKAKYPDLIDKYLLLLTYAGRIEYRVALSSDENLQKTLLDLHTYCLTYGVMDTLDTIVKSFYIRKRDLIGDDDLLNVLAESTSLITIPGEPPVDIESVANRFKGYPTLITLYLLYYGISK